MFLTKPFLRVGVASALGAFFSFSAAANAANYTVTSSNDAGAGTLRQAILNANASPGADSIKIALPAGYKIVGITTAGHKAAGDDLSAFLITDTLSIEGPGANLMSIKRVAGPRVSNFRLFRIASGVDVRIKGVTISHGETSTYTNQGSSFRYNGGGVYNEGQLELEGCMISHNLSNNGFGSELGIRSGGLGGGIYSSGKLAVSGSTFYNNSAVLGGGGLYATGELSISNSTFHLNSAREGGAVHCGAGASFESCTIGGNRATTNAGILALGAITVRNSIVGGNLGGSSPDLNVKVGKGNYVGPNPKLGILKDNGGLVSTMALAPGSPAIDAGQTALTTDQRGVARPFGVAADFGAFEFNQVLPFSFTDLELTPINPFPGDKLVADPSAYDPQHRPLTFTYVWTRIRSGVSFVLPNKGNSVSLTQPTILPGDRITVTVTVSNGVDAPLSRTATAAIFNSAISISALTLQPKMPYTFEKMIATVKTVDEDKTRPFYTYVWTRNGAVVQTVTNTRNSQDFYELNKNGYGDKNDLIEVTVTVSDGASTDSQKVRATVRNSIPVLSSLTLAPQTPKVGAVITSTYGGRDADGDTQSRIYKWKVGNKVLGGETGSRLDLAKYPNIKAGDIVTLEMRLSDGVSLSKTLSASVTVTPASPATVSGNSS